MSSGVMEQLNGLLRHEDCNVITPALRTLGNFVTGDDCQTQVGSGKQKVLFLLRNLYDFAINIYFLVVGTQLCEAT